MRLSKTLPLYCFIDIVLIALCFIFSYIFYYNDFQAINTHKLHLPYLQEYLYVFIFQSFLLVLELKRAKLYQTIRETGFLEEAFRVASKICLVGIITASLIFFAKFKFYSRTVFLFNFTCLFFSLTLWRISKRRLIRYFIKKGYKDINILIVGNGKHVNEVVEYVLSKPHLGFNIVGYLNAKPSQQLSTVKYLGTLGRFDSIVKKFFVEEIVLSDELTTTQTIDIIKKTQSQRLGLKMIPKFSEYVLPEVTNFGMVPLMTFKHRISHPSFSTAKRSFDIVISSVLLIILSPLMLMIALIIKIESAGPIIFVQERMGIKGKRFNLYKFRYMLNNSELKRESLLEMNDIKDGVMFKIKNDPRITNFGRLIRKYSLDELPQLLNVLKGDMSLVGPRPPLSEEVNRYEDLQMDRLIVKPGMTGVSQIRGRSELTFSKWVRWDLWYVNNWTIALDIKILLLTVPAVLKCRGAY